MFSSLRRSGMALGLFPLHTISLLFIENFPLYFSVRFFLRSIHDPKSIVYFRMAGNRDLFALHEHKRCCIINICISGNVEHCKRKKKWKRSLNNKLHRFHKKYINSGFFENIEFFNFAYNVIPSILLSILIVVAASLFLCLFVCLVNKCFLFTYSINLNAFFVSFFFYFVETMTTTT